MLNALIGANCLPANNVPETARITRITHAAGQALLVDNTAEPARTVFGEEEIKAYLRQLNSEARTRDHLLTDEVYLDLHLPVAALQGNIGISSAAETTTLRLLDTPGPNEAGEIALKAQVGTLWMHDCSCKCTLVAGLCQASAQSNAVGSLPSRGACSNCSLACIERERCIMCAQVERLLDSVDAVIYLLDYTKLKTADEAEVLQRLKEINPQLISRLSQRLFFVVNKADMIETSEGMDAEATREYVADLVTSQMRDESFQLSPDQVGSQPACLLVLC